MQVDRKLFAGKLKAFKDGPNQQKQSSPGFGMKVLENVNQRMLPSLSFKSLGEVSVPILSEVKIQHKLLSTLNFFKTLFPFFSQGFSKIEINFRTCSQPERTVGNRTTI